MLNGIETRASFRGRLTYKALSDVTGTITINPAQDYYPRVTLTGTGRTIAFTSVPRFGWGALLYVKQDGTGSRTITGYPSFWSWMGGSAPNWTTTPGHMDIVSMISDGLNVFATLNLNGVSSA